MRQFDGGLLVALFEVAAQHGFKVKRLVNQELPIGNQCSTVVKNKCKISFISDLSGRTLAPTESAAPTTAPLFTGGCPSAQQFFNTRHGFFLIRTLQLGQDAKQNGVRPEQETIERRMIFEKVGDHEVDEVGWRGDGVRRVDGIWMGGRDGCICGQVCVICWLVGI
uniref:Uncharacterized protein n=2 Tax=Cacopsylla melanoneura TaxID=428564 RepID=A0A8D8ZRC9_9HEMI